MKCKVCGRNLYVIRSDGKCPYCKEYQAWDVDKIDELIPGDSDLTTRLVHGIPDRFFNEDTGEMQDV